MNILQIAVVQHLCIVYILNLCRLCYYLVLITDYCHVEFTTYQRGNPYILTNLICNNYNLTHCTIHAKTEYNIRTPHDSMQVDASYGSMNS